jgi:hypothetical protein
MTLLHTLQSTRALARWVLLCWCLVLGVAVAAPLVQPVNTMQVCTTSGGMAMPDGDSPAPTLGHHLDCVLCLGAGAPPSALPSADAPPAAATAAPWAPAVLAVHSASAAPPPGRGPPAA